MYEVREVPFEERGPIASFQLEAIAEANPIQQLDVLDQMDLLALVRVDGDDQRLDGLAYLVHAGMEREAMLGLYWTRPDIPTSARKQLLAAIDDWALKRDVAVIRGIGSRIPTGFQTLGLKVVERELPGS